MRFARVLFTIAAVTGALAAVSASNAFAVEVVQEVTGVHCPAVTEVAGGTPEVSGGCPFTAQAANFELGFPFGNMSICTLSLEGHMGESGEAIAAQPTWTGGSLCGVQPCVANGNRHPRIRITGVGAPPWAAELKICFSGAGTEFSCHLAGTFNELAGHNYSVTLAHQNKCENHTWLSFSGQLVFGFDVAHPKIEVK